MTERPVVRRLKRLRSRLRRSKLDALFVTGAANVRYLSGFSGDSSGLLITPADAVFLTDFRYAEQAAAECPGYRIVVRRKDSFTTAARQARRLGVARLGVEADALTLGGAERLRAALGRTEMVGTTGLVAELRAVKTGEEVRAIEGAVRAAERCFEHAKGFLVPGIRERDVAAEMEYFVRGLGLEGLAFPPVVAFGPRGSLPHARATHRQLGAGEPILIDWGVAADGYVCDLTRVLFHHKIPAKFEKMYRIVLEAQRRALRRIRPGVATKDVDAAARGPIRKAGFGRRFGHGLGHGIGMEVHELPALGPESSVVLRRGMVLTIEPGVYVPGLGGVRIEDDVLVTPKGARVLSTVPKHLKDVVVGG